jgi:hypothetical protein
LKDASEQQIKIDREPQQQQELIHNLQYQVADTKGELERVREQLGPPAQSTNASPFPDSTQASYADITRIPLIERPENPRHLPPTDPSLLHNRPAAREPRNTVKPGQAMWLVGVTYS